MKSLLPSVALLSFLLAACAQPAAPAPSARPAAPASSASTAADPVLRAQSTFAVTSALDSGPGSLRQALADAAGHAGPDTVTFALPDPSTITLTSGELVIDGDVTIVGPGAARLALSGGGASRVLHVVGGTVSLSGVTIRNGNTTSSPDRGHGGGIFHESGDLTLVDVVVRDNVARGDYGGGVASFGRLSIERSAIVNNRAGELGGGVFGGFANTVLTLTNTTLSGNVAAVAGGGLYADGRATLTFVTVADNQAGVRGGGVALQGYVGPNALGASVVARNTAPLGADAVVADEVLQSLGHNVIGEGVVGKFFPGQGDLLGSTGAPLDAGLGVLADNGGSAPTHALAESSPVRDLVPVASCAAAPTDQRGVTRPQGGACDAGAFEAVFNTAPGAPGLTGPAFVTNASPVVVTWSAATDAEGDPLTYTLEGRDADDAAFAVLGTSAANATSLSLPALAEGTWTLRLKANDGTFDGPYSAERVVKVDRTPPAAPGSTVSGTLVNGWYKDSATVSFTPGSDPALPDGSSGSGTVFTTASQTFTMTGVFSASGVSRDAANNTSASTTVNVQVDASVPTVGFTNCAPQVTIGSATSVNWTASDTGSGLATLASGSVPLDTATVGPKSVSVTSRDKVGHEITQTCAYTVVYPFGGFVGLQSPPNLNTSPYPYTIVTFTLGGNYGKEIYAPGFPAYRTIDCTTKAPLSGWTPAFVGTAGNLTQYDAATKRYQFGWSMTSSWTGCRELNLRTNDGVDHSLFFRR